MAPHSSTLAWKIPWMKKKKKRKSHGWRSPVGCSPWGCKELDTTEWPHFHFYALEKEMATHSSVLFFFFFSFSFIFISWRLITLQHCSGFCHTLKWISHGFTCIPHPSPPPTSLSTQSLWVFPVHQVRALDSCIQPGLVICFTLALQCSCLENPRDSRAWRAAVYGVAQSRTQLTADLAAAAAHLCLPVTLWTSCPIFGWDTIPGPNFMHLIHKISEKTLWCKFWYQSDFSTNFYAKVYTP